MTSTPGPVGSNVEKTGCFGSPCNFLLKRVKSKGRVRVHLESMDLTRKSWWPEDAVAVVTGSNAGIGFEIVKGLAKHGIKTVVLAARNIQSGQQAAELLHQQGLSNVLFHQLDITESSSIEAFTSWIRKTFKGVDILVNNAGIGSTQDTTETVIRTNYHGTKELTTSLTGFMRTGARIINVSSSASRLDFLVDESWRQKLQDSENIITEELLEQFLEDFQKLSSSGKQEQMIMPPMGAYNISKMALNGYSQLLAKKLEPSSITVNSFCPGHTSTKLSFNTGHDAAAGAETGVWLALANKHELSTGEFYVNRKRFRLDEIPYFIHGRMIYPLDEWLACMNQMFSKIKYKF